MAAKNMRSTTAAAMPQKMTLAADLLGNARGGETDDDGVVARQHQVDHDDVDEGDEVLAIPVDGNEMLRFFAYGPEQIAEVLQ